MGDPLALLDFADRSATLTLNRPEARNALSVALLDALHLRLGELEARLAADDSLRALLLAGAGKAFCAGMDLKAVLGEPEAATALLRSLAELTLRLRRLPLVVVARVQGAAIGGGCGLACVCDLAITHDDAKLGFPEVDLGLCPAVVAPWVLRRVGPGRARQVLLSGGLMTGRQAAEAGLVTHSEPGPQALDDAVEELLERICRGGARALRATKALLNEIDGSDDAAMLMRGADLSASVLATPEAQAALRAKFGDRGAGGQ